MLNFRSFFEHNDELLETIVQHPQQWSFINPRTGKNWRFEDRFKQLARIVKDQSRKGVHPNRIWVTFSDVPRINIITKVKKDKSTPHGIFAYPAKYVLEKQGADYAANRSYMIVFKVKGNMIEVGRDPEIKDKNLKGLVQKDPMPDDLNYNRLSSKFSDMAYYSSDYAKRSELRDLSEFLSEIISHIELKEKQNADLNYFKTPEGILDSYANHYLNDHLKNYYNGTFDGEKITINKTHPYKNGVELGTHPIEYFADKDSDIEYYLNYSKTIKNKFEKALQNEEFKKAIKELTDMMGKRIEFKNKKITEKNRPIVDKVAAMAKEYGIDDIKPFITQVSESDTFHRGTQFIYLLIKALAGHVAEKTGRNRAVIWASMLRKIGFTHVVDSKHSSVIHSGEPTQGVFMDTNQIEPVGIIFNTKRPDPRMLPSGYEKDKKSDDDDDEYDPHKATGTWLPGSGHHSRTGLITQRRGEELPGVGDKENIFDVLATRIDIVKRKMGGGYSGNIDFYSPEFQKNLHNLFRFAKQIKSSVNPNNHEERTRAENVLHKLEIFMSSLTSKIDDLTKDQENVSPPVKEYLDDLKSRIKTIEKVIKEPGFKTGIVKKMNPLDAHAIIKDILTKHGPLDANGINRELANFGIRGGLNTALEMLVLDKVIHKKYSDIFEGYVYYLPGQKVPTLEDYEPEIMKVLGDTHKTTQQIEDALGGKITRSVLEPVLKLLSYNDKIKRTRGVEGDYVWHAPQYDYNAKVTEKHKDQILNWVKEQEDSGKPNVTGQEILTHFSYEHGLNLLPVLNAMLQNKMINVEEGTFGQNSTGELRLTTKPVTQPKPMYFTPVKDYINGLFTTPNKVFTGKELASKVYYGINVNSLFSKAIIDMLIASGDLHVIEDNEDTYLKKLSKSPPPAAAAAPTPTQTTPVPSIVPAPHPGAAAAPTPTTGAIWGPQVKDHNGTPLKVGDKVHKSINPSKTGVVTKLSGEGSGTATVDWDDGQYSGNSYYGNSLSIIGSPAPTPAPSPVKPLEPTPAQTAAKAAWQPPTPEEKQADLATKVKTIQEGLPKKLAKNVKYARLIRGVGSNLSIENVMTELEPLLGFKFTPIERESIKNTYDEETKIMNYYDMRGHLKFPKGMTPDQAYTSLMKSFPNPPHVALDAETKNKLEELLVQHNHPGALKLIKAATQFGTGAATALVVLKKLEAYSESKVKDS